MKALMDSLTVQQLVDRFVEIGLAQERALFEGKHAKFNHLFREMSEVDSELRKRGASARLALLELFNHPNIQVRMKAAKRSLAVAPDAARRVLMEIEKTGHMPQAGEAGITLELLADGTFTPD